MKMVKIAKTEEAKITSSLRFKHSCEIMLFINSFAKAK